MKIVVYNKEFNRALEAMKFTEKDMRNMEYAGSRPLVNYQRQNVPKDTAATSLSIDSHIIEASSIRVVDDIGPETNYAVYLEYGTGEFAESGDGRKGGWLYKDHNGWHFTRGMAARPYVRPSVSKGSAEVFNAIEHALVKIVSSRWKT